MSTLDYPIGLHHPYRMTIRARAYLGVVGLRHLALAVALFVAGDAFVADAFVPLRQVAGFQVWAWILLVVGLFATYGFVSGREWAARGTLIASCVITSVWASALVASGLMGELQTPLLPIVWCSMLLKDLISAAIPLRSPFEDYFIDVATWRPS